MVEHPANRNQRTQEREGEPTKRTAVLLALVTTAFCAAAIGATLRASAALSAPSSKTSYASGVSTGGPDTFGYTWDDTVPYTWIDARSLGTEANIRGDDAVSDEIPLGFTFKFYENSYTHCYLGTNGLLTLGSPSLASNNTSLPLPFAPGNLIAPLWDDLCVDCENQNSGRVFYWRGGSSPDRYLVVEWWEVSRTGSSARLTFEVVLYESGDILFQYMSLNGELDSCTVGIQNSTGRDGLQYLYNAPGLSAGKAIKFHRPPNQARVGLYPPRQGQLATGQAVSYTLQIQNLGDWGPDTFELAATSVWPLGFYDSSGTAQLVDTDGDGQVDTGQLASAEATTVTVRVTIPTAASVGSWDHATVTFTSSIDSNQYRTAVIASAVPAVFAQSYTEGWDPFGALDGEAGLGCHHSSARRTADLRLAKGLLESARPSHKRDRVYYHRSGSRWAGELPAHGPCSGGTPNSGNLTQLGCGFERQYRFCLDTTIAPGMATRHHRLRE